MLHSAGIGLDVHARSISAAAYAFGTGGAVQRTFGYGPTDFGLQGRPVALGPPCHAGAVPGALSAT